MRIRKATGNVVALSELVQTITDDGGRGRFRSSWLSSVLVARTALSLSVEIDANKRRHLVALLGAFSGSPASICAGAAILSGETRGV
jgi:hypothetical protein